MARSSSTQAMRRLRRARARGKLRRVDKERLSALKEGGRSEAASRRAQVDAEGEEARASALAEEEEAALPDDMLDEEQSWTDWEAGGRRFGGVDEASMRQLLPIKTARGVLVSRSCPVDDDDGDELMDEAPSPPPLSPASELPSEAPFEPTSAADLMRRHAQLTEEYKLRIAALCEAVIEEPQLSVHKLRTLVDLSTGESIAEPFMKSKVTRLATASLLEVFIDTIPGYAYRDRTQAEQNEKLKKETRQMYAFEEAFIRNYKKFLSHLLKHCKEFSKNMKKDSPAPSAMGLLCVRALCKLLSTHPHFNFRNNLINSVVGLAAQSEAQVCRLGFARAVDRRRFPVQSACSDALGGVFVNDKKGDASLEIAKAVDRNTRLTPALLTPFLKLRIKEVARQGKKADDRKKTKDARPASIKERKYRKQLAGLERELREAEAEEDQHLRLRLNTKIMKHVFATYFRVLRRRARSDLLEPVLEGLAKFAHLINVDFFDDLIGSLRQLVEEDSLAVRSSLHCILTAMTILSGDGQALAIDPSRLYRLVYRLLPRIALDANADRRRANFRLAFKALHLMIVERRKHVSAPTVGAFVKRLCLLALVTPPPSAIGCLASVRAILLAHPRLQDMLDADDDDGMSARAADAACDDPARANADAADLRELGLIVRAKRCPPLTAMARYLVSRLPSTGASRLPPELIKKPWELEKVETYETAPIVAISELKRKSLDAKSLCLAIQQHVSLKLSK